MNLSCKINCGLSVFNASIREADTYSLVRALFKLAKFYQATGWLTQNTSQNRDQKNSWLLCSE